MGEWGSGAKEGSQKKVHLGSQLGTGQLELSHSGNAGEAQRTGNSDLWQLNVNGRVGFTSVCPVQWHRAVV